MVDSGRGEVSGDDDDNWVDRLGSGHIGDCGVGSEEQQGIGSDRDFQVRGYSPPILKKIFFADLHDLVHERKKCENDPILPSTPP